MSELNNLVSIINSLISKQDGSKLSQILSLPLISPNNEQIALVARFNGINITSYCKSNVRDHDMAMIVANYLLTLESIIKLEFKEAFEKFMVR